MTEEEGPCAGALNSSVVPKTVSLVKLRDPAGDGRKWAQLLECHRSPVVSPSLPCPSCRSTSHLSVTLPLSSVATVNDLACRGLDKLEEKLPFLQQPSDTVLEMTRPRGTP